jgi:cardiolipin synthase
MRKLCRMLFSRYTISAILILLEVLIIVYFPLGRVTAYVAMALSFVISVIAAVNLINKDANPEYKISWLVVIMMFMPLGAAMYFLFYSRRMSKREAMLMRGTIGELRGYDFFEDGYKSLEETSSLASGKARAIMAEDMLADVYVNTDSIYFSTGEKFFEALISDIEMAKNFIFLEYFIIDEGVIWDRIHSVLKKKAAEGCDVRLIYDDIGCMRTLPRKYELTLREEGIKAYRFARINPRISSVHHNRDHRKICVVDGRLAYTGGVNIADEYANLINRFGYWKDGGVRIVGDAVAGFTKMFLSLWDFTSGSISDYGKFLKASEREEKIKGEGYYLPFGSGPAPIYSRPVGKNAFLNIINQSEKYVYITTPYLIIDYDLTQSLCNAAMRGVDVRIVTPGIPDKKIIKIMTKSAYPYLMKAGVKIYEYAPGFMHEKNVICDDKYAVIGTINFDYRSLVHHFECAVWMYRTPTVLDAARAFDATLSVSTPVTRKSSRLTFVEWLFRTGIRIFSPLL